jgi:hypothetical protein
VAIGPLTCVIEILEGAATSMNTTPSSAGSGWIASCRRRWCTRWITDLCRRRWRPMATRWTCSYASRKPPFQGCVVVANPIGLFRMEDEKGPDDHVVCVPCDDPGWNLLADVTDLPARLRAEISHFFAVYKDLDSRRRSKVNGWADRAAALTTISEARSRFHSERPHCSKPPQEGFQPSTPRPLRILPGPPGSGCAPTPPRGSRQ